MRSPRLMLRQSTVRTPLLDIGYLEAGPEHGRTAILIHGFPYDALACAEAGLALADEGWRVLMPWMRGYGPTRFRSGETLRSGEQAAFGSDLLAFMDAMSIDRAVLAGYDWGGRAACVVSALWPERVSGLVSIGGYNIFDRTALRHPAHPEQEWRMWYCFYFLTERGRDGLARNRRDLTRLLWRQWSPTWSFDDETFARSADAFDNPDFVEVVIHSYRHRFERADGDPGLASLEARLATLPAIEVPSVLLQGSDDGVYLYRDFDRARFPRLAQAEIVPGGHNLIQENPAAVVQAVRVLASLPGVTG
jgi:pimeloyl-ACP methyl ester carboxylesterase